MGARAHRVVAGLLTLASFALFAGAAAARPWAGPVADAVVTWQAPTPGEGVQVIVAPGGRATISLAAAASGEPVPGVRITAQELPGGATLDSREGNPATAIFSWRPLPGQAGTHVITFTATSTGTPAVAAEPRRIVVIARAKARPAKKRVRPTIPAVRTLSGVNDTYRWAKLLRRAAARSAPSPSARVVHMISFLTPENTQNLVALLESRRINGREWVKVRLAKLPNNSVGWVRRSDLGAFRLVRTRLLINRSAFTATLYRAGRKVFQARIGVGQSHWPTPRGEYYVRMKLCCYSNAIYGPYAFGLSARSSVLTDWPGGGHIGIHGTNAPGLIPGRISHGCIRLRNADITRLNRLLPVGTPVSIR
jgi:lipoprotein-anchoring transpeptidase ErfK/SrfK